MCFSSWDTSWYACQCFQCTNGEKTFQSSFIPNAYQRCTSKKSKSFRNETAWHYKEMRKFWEMFTTNQWCDRSNQPSHPQIPRLILFFQLLLPSLISVFSNFHLMHQLRDHSISYQWLSECQCDIWGCFWNWNPRPSLLLFFWHTATSSEGSSSWKNSINDLLFFEVHLW